MNIDEIKKSISFGIPALPEFKMPDMPKITPASHWMSGEASYKALTKIVSELTELAPEDHDIILISDNGLEILDVRYFEPHTFVLCAHDEQGNAIYDVLHYSQLRVRIAHFPKKQPERRRIGFHLG